MLQLQLVHPVRRLPRGTAHSSFLQPSPRPRRRARLSPNFHPARPNEVIRSPIFHCRLVVVGLNAVQRRTLLRSRLLRRGRVHSHVHRKRNVQRGLRPFHHSRVRHFRAEPSTYSHRGPFVNTYCPCCAYAWWLSRRNNVRRRRSSSSMCPTYRFCGRHFRRSSVLRVTLGVPWQSTTSFQQRGIRAWARRKKVNARSSVLKAFSSVFLNCLSLRSNHRDRSCLCRCSLSVGFKSVPVGQFSFRAENTGSGSWKSPLT